MIGSAALGKTSLCYVLRWLFISGSVSPGNTVLFFVLR